MVNYYISDNCITIIDSYLIEDRDSMYTILKEIYNVSVSKGINCNIFYIRSYDSMVEEWCSHNLLYNLHLFRNRTKDVDINDINWFEKLMYKVVSWLYVG